MKQLLDTINIFIIYSSLFKYFFAITYAMRDGREADNKKFIPYVTYLSLATIIVMGFYKNQ